jgi:hypothetical protein
MEIQLLVLYVELLGVLMGTLIVSFGFYDLQGSLGLKCDSFSLTNISIQILHEFLLLL